MKKTKKYLLTGVALAGMFLIGSLMRSRDSQARGAYSTPVTVMNTSSAPAIGSSVDEPGRVPYLSQVALGSSSCTPFQTCAFSFPPVPAGKRLVIQQVGGFIQLVFNAAPTAAKVAVCYSATFCDGFLANAVNDNNFNVSLAEFDHPFVGYFDAGTTPVVSIQPANTQFPSAAANSSEVATLKGYLIDCTAAPCAPIAH